MALAPTNTTRAPQLGYTKEPSKWKLATCPPTQFPASSIQTHNLALSIALFFLQGPPTLPYHVHVVWWRGQQDH